MSHLEPEKTFKALGDRSRLAIVRALAREPGYVERLAAQLDLAPSTVSFHLRKLQKAGLVASTREQYYVVYALNGGMLDHSLREVIGVDEDEEARAHRRKQAYRRDIQGRFLKRGRLVSIPVQRKKRRIILEALLTHFQPGRPYPEPEVNQILARFHEDVCTLRREMICEKLMQREDGVYRVVEPAALPE